MQLFCVSLKISDVDLTDCSWPGFSVLGISQARLLEGVAISLSRGSNLHLPLGRPILYRWATWEAPQWNTTQLFKKKKWKFLLAGTWVDVEGIMLSEVNQTEKEITIWYHLYVLCLVAQLCPTLFNPMDCSPPGSSVLGHSPGKNTGVGCHALLQIFPTQWSSPGLTNSGWILYHLSHQGSLSLTCGI